MCYSHLSVCCQAEQREHHFSVSYFVLEIKYLKTKAPNTTGSNHLYNNLELLMMGIVVPEKC